MNLNPPRQRNERKPPPIEWGAHKPLLMIAIVQTAALIAIAAYFGAQDPGAQIARPVIDTGVADSR